MRFHHKQSFPLDLHRFDIRHLGAFPSLATHRIIMQIGFTVVGSFYPIFIYEFVSQNLVLMFWWFAICYGLRIPLYALAAKFFSRVGLRASMMMGVIMWMLYYAGGLLLDVSIDFNTNLILFASFLTLAFYHALYWAPFHVDFAKFSRHKFRGREVSLLHIMRYVIGIFVPIGAGLLITLYSYKAIFIIGICAGPLSLIPLLFLPKTHVQYEFGYFETFKKLLSKKFSYLTISSMAQGVESATSYIAWPVFLFIIFKGEYLDVGIFSALIILVSLVLQWIMGRLVDKKSPKRYLGLGARVYSLGWFIKAFVDSVVGVFGASTFHSFGAILMRTPFDTMVYEKAADSGHYIDEFTVIREIAVTIGRFSIVVAMAILAVWLPLTTAFVLAGVASLAISLLARFVTGDAFGT